MKNQAFGEYIYIYSFFPGILSKSTILLGDQDETRRGEEFLDCDESDVVFPSYFVLDWRQDGLMTYPPSN